MPYRPLPKPPIAGDVVGFLVMTTNADPPPARWILRAHWSEHEPRCDLYLLDAPDPRYMPADSRVGDRLVALREDASPRHEAGYRLELRDDPRAAVAECVAVDGELTGWRLHEASPADALALTVLHGFVEPELSKNGLQ